MRENAGISRPFGRIDVLAAVALFVLAVALPIAWCMLHPYACMMGEDAGFWGSAATWVSRGSLSESALLQRQPLVPVLVAALSWFTGDVPQAATLVAVLSFGMLPALIYLVVRQVAQPWAALAAAVGIAGVYPVMGGALKSNADPVFLVLTVVLAGVAGWLASNPTRRTAAALGLALGVALLCKPTALLFVPVCLALAGWRRQDRWARVGLFVAVALLLSVPWAIFEWLSVGQSMRSVSMVLRDTATGSYSLDGRDKIAEMLASEGWGVDFIAQGALVRLGGTVGLNLLRLLLVLGAFVLPLAGLARWSRVWPPSAAMAWAALGASCLFALPVMWQPRHMVPFAVLLGMAGCAALTGVWARGVVALATSVWLVTAGLCLSSWTQEARTYRCDGGAQEVAQWLSEQPQDPPLILAQHAPAVRAYGGLTQEAGLWPERAFLNGPPIEGHPKARSLYLVVGSSHPAFRYPIRSIRRRGMRDEVELAHEFVVNGAPVRIYRLQWGGADTAP